MKKTHHGSCHCGAVTYEADIDLQNGTGKCNCTFCWKQRMWNAGQLAPSEFRLLTGADKLSDYRKSGEWGEVHHHFCSVCGIATHGHGIIEQLGGAYVTVQLASLNDLPVAELIAAPVRYMDGRHDRWEAAPAETRHL
jgi:hypothetical protein